MSEQFKFNISPSTVHSIMGVLSEAGRPLSTTEIAHRSGKSYGTVDRVLKQRATRLPGYRAYWVYPEANNDEWNELKAGVAEWLKTYDPTRAPFKADVEKLEWLARVLPSLHHQAQMRLDSLPQ